MLAAERRDLLVTRLRRDGKLVARDLAQELGLSEDSVRRDLRAQVSWLGRLEQPQSIGALGTAIEETLDLS